MGGIAVYEGRHDQDVVGNPPCRLFGQATGANDIHVKRQMRAVLFDGSDRYDHRFFRLDGLIDFGPSQFFVAPGFCSHGGLHSFSFVYRRPAPGHGCRADRLRVKRSCVIHHTPAGKPCYFRRGTHEYSRDRQPGENSVWPCSTDSEHGKPTGMRPVPSGFRRSTRCLDLETQRCVNEPSYP